MISTAFCRLSSRYNHWQNTSIVTAASQLSHDERWADQGAFFKSIAATLNHLYWADALILERIKGNERPQDTVTHSLTAPSDWDVFKSLRAQRDAEIEDWATRLAPSDLEGKVSWGSLDGAGRVEMAKTTCIVQLFSHQTHHRGQVHTMLTAQGIDPGPTDIWLTPDS